MRKALRELNEQLEEALDEIKTGAGINTGPCVVGNFGSVAVSIIVFLLMLSILLR